MTNKHTPGPWYYGAFGETIRAESTDAILARVDNGGHVDGKHLISDEEIKANARLIAAAPELLAVLEKWCEFMEVNYSPDDISWWKETQAAIAKAEGRE